MPDKLFLASLRNMPGNHEILNYREFDLQDLCCNEKWLHCVFLRKPQSFCFSCSIDPLDLLFVQKKVVQFLRGPWCLPKCYPAPELGSDFGGLNHQESFFDVFLEGWSLIWDTYIMCSIGAVLCQRKPHHFCIIDGKHVAEYTGTTFSFERLINSLTKRTTVRL